MRRPSGEPTASLIDARAAPVSLPLIADQLVRRPGFSSMVLALLAVLSWLTFAWLVVRRCARDAACYQGAAGYQAATAGDALAGVAFGMALAASWAFAGRMALRAWWSESAALWIASVTLGCVGIGLLVTAQRLGFLAEPLRPVGWLVVLFAPAAVAWVLGWLVVFTAPFLPLVTLLRRLARLQRTLAGLGLWLISVALGGLALLPAAVSLAVGPEVAVFQVLRFLSVL